MLNKKGLSNIIATVLIILLALAAIVIVWQFIKPVITTTSEQTSLQTKCLQVEAVPVKCATGTGIDAGITFQLKTGNKADIAKVIGIVEDATAGTRKTAETTTIPDTFGTGPISFISESILSTNIAKVAIVVTDGTNTATCTESSTTVVCT